MTKYENSLIEERILVLNYTIDDNNKSNNNQDVNFYLEIYAIWNTKKAKIPFHQALINIGGL